MSDDSKKKDQDRKAGGTAEKERPTSTEEPAEGDEQVIDEALRRDRKQ